MARDNVRSEGEEKTRQSGHRAHAMTTQDNVLAGEGGREGVRIQGMVGAQDNVQSEEEREIG